MSELIRGSAIAHRILEKTKNTIAGQEHPPGLAAIIVGDDEASHLYVDLKERAAKEVGIYFEKIAFKADVKQEVVITAIEDLNTRKDIHGILVQLPLPTQNADAVIATIHPDKDVDGFHQISQERLSDDRTGLVPPVALSVMRLIQATNQPLKDKHAVVVSNNPIFAEPILRLMQDIGMGGNYVAPDAGGFEAKLRVADILIVAVGRPGFITKSLLKEGVIIIDVGTTKDEFGKLVGDCDTDVREIAGFKSAVPGGVGPLTVAFLMNNVLKAQQMQK